MRQIIDHTFHLIHTIGKQQRQPVTETALTVFKRAPAQPAAQAGGRDRGTKDCADTGTLNGMQNLYRFRLLFRALPPRMLCAVCRALADGISGIVLGSASIPQPLMWDISGLRELLSKFSMGFSAALNITDWRAAE